MPTTATGLRLTAAALVLAPIAAAPAQIATSTVVFPRGASATSVAGAITGDQTRDYVVRASAGQAMHVTLTGSTKVYFNVLAPGSEDTAIFIGSSAGNSFSAPLTVSGAYKIRVYQMRATARRGERGAFRLAIAVTNAGGATTR